MDHNVKMRVVEAGLSLYAVGDVKSMYENTEYTEEETTTFLKEHWDDIKRIAERAVIIIANSYDWR